MSSNRICSSKNAGVPPDDAQKAAVYFLYLIMSKLSREEMQNEAINYLISSQDLLMISIKQIGNIRFPIVQNTDSGYSRPDDGARRYATTSDTDALSSIMHDYDSFMNYGKNSTDSTRTESFSRRKRKSKYSDIDGDLSHIRLDPKCSKYNKEEDAPVLKAQKKRTKKPLLNKTYERIEDNEVNRVYARKLLDILIHSGSKKHQDNVLAILRSDQSLLEIFLQEKLHAGNKKIPVYKTNKPHEMRRYSQSIESSSYTNKESQCSTTRVLDSMRSSSPSSEVIPEHAAKNNHVFKTNGNKTSLEKESESEVPFIENALCDMQQLQTNSDKNLEGNSLDQVLYSSLISLANEFQI